MIFIENERSKGESGLNTKGAVCIAEERSENGDGGRDPDGLWWSGKAGTGGR